MDSRPILRILVAVFGLVAAIGLFIDVRNTTIGGSIDLRNRVTGARVAADHVDPFTYKWNPAEPERFCDPYNAPGWKYSKTTVTPLALALHLPLAGMNYRRSQWLWFWVQYGCLALGFLAWAWTSPAAPRGWGAVITLALCGTAAWRIHVDRGQIYVLYAALFLVLASVAMRRGPLWSLLEGTLGGLVFGLRPTIIGQFAAPLIRRRLPVFAGIAAGLALMVALPTAAFGPAIWNDYREGMDGHAELYLRQAKPERLSMPFPATVEGIKIDQLAKFAWIPFADSSVYRLVSHRLPARLLLACWAAAMLASVVIMALRRPAIPAATMWWAFSAWFVVGDFLLPAYRHNYNDLLVWPMLLLGLSALEGTPRRVWIGLCSAWLLASLAVWFVPKGWIAAPSVLALPLALGVSVAVLLPQRTPATAAGSG